MVCGIVCSRAVLYIVGIAALSVHITHIFSRREGRARHRHVHMYTCTHVHMYTCTHVHIHFQRTRHVAGGRSPAAAEEGRGCPAVEAA